MAKRIPGSKGGDASRSFRPSREDILGFIKENPDQAGKRELARAFGLKGADRVWLKDLLRELQDEGLLEKRAKRFTRPGALPHVVVLDIFSRDADGLLLARPTEWPQENGAAPTVSIRPPRADRARVPGVGERVLAKVFPAEEAGGPAYTGRVMKVFEKRREAVLGVFRTLRDGTFRIEPVERRQPELIVDADYAADARNGDLVEVEQVSSGRYGLPKAKVLAVLGSLESEKAVSMIAIHAHDIPHIFPPEVLEEAEALKPLRFRAQTPPPLTPPLKGEGDISAGIPTSPLSGGRQESRSAATAVEAGGGISASSGGEWFIFGSGIAEEYHMRWFEKHLPGDDSVKIEALGLSMVGLAIAGPNARKLLEKVTRADVSNAAFPFMSIRRMDIGMAPCLVGRVSYTGDLGYEIWMAPEYQRHVFETLMAAGEEFGIGLFGSRALNALRLDKNYGSWAREYRPIYGPLEAGLDRFVAYGKTADFIGKTAALAEREQGGKLRLRSFVVDAVDADVIGDEAIWFDGAVCGWVTSGGYAHHSRKSVAMGYVPREIADAQAGFEIELLGKRLPARIQATPLFDANFERMRS